MFQFISRDWHKKFHETHPKVVSYDVLDKIAKFQETLSTGFGLKCKSGKNFADFMIFLCVSSHISTLTHRNFTKLIQ